MDKNTDWNKVADELRKIKIPLQEHPFDDLRAAVDLCERMARGELVEAHRVIDDPANAAYLKDMFGDEVFAAAVKTSDPTQSERDAETAHCERVVDTAPRTGEFLGLSRDDVVDLLLRERDDAARKAKSECEAELKTLRAIVGRVKERVSHWSKRDMNQETSYGQNDVWEDFEAAVQK